MKRLPIAQLKPGMVTAEDVFTYDQQLIVPADVVLTANIISRLEFYSIFSIRVEDELFDYSLDTDSQEPSLKTSIHNSTEFIRFQKDFEEQVEQFHVTIHDMMEKKASIDTKEILASTLNLLYQDGHKLNVFDMLTNMRDYDDSTYTHSINVALISYVFAGWLNFSEQDKIIAASCGLFHDIGKLCMPQEIIHKPGKLTPEEFEVMKTHTQKGYEILTHYSLNAHILNAALLHHEKCDGSGYPYGIHAEKIDRFAKLVTIADIYDAMTSARVYRKPICPFTVIETFENEGLQKYEAQYILTFLEKISNTYLNHKVRLSNGMQGNVIFINKIHLSRPTIHCKDAFLDLSSKPDVKIEEIL